MKWKQTECAALCRKHRYVGITRINIYVNFTIIRARYISLTKNNRVKDKNTEGEVKLSYRRVL